MSIATLLRVVDDMGMIFSKQLYAKGKRVAMEILPKSLLKIQLVNC